MVSRMSVFVAVRFATWVGVLGCAFTLSGCGGRSGTQHDLSGTVTFGGQPLPAGQILLSPNTAKGNAGPATIVTIRDGKYDTREANRGTVGGPHVATITGYDGKSDPAGELPDGRTLFSDYRIEVDLPNESTTMDFDVPGTLR
ncbi:MAG: hypothetical protein U1E05_15600 [Patescibacteria group bacterium]|nr:hypothetical protein [Patescibacteria group bacterium]